MKSSVLGALVTSAFVTIASSSAFANEAAKGAAKADPAAKKADPAAKSEAFCQNSTCKGHSACKGHGNEAGCKGQNSCKGHGWLDAKDDAACKTAGGKWMAAKK
ncbi:MAG: hypothetical protein NTV34_04000 [Proteobacteria bacterium]|nr:hypothetical protein [Pseudomonadota bacterium]